ncbi:hypothetical protein EZJ49_02710 [Bdellovibrio bacteriovorus]|uniref:hypothetical protein n=1 Tax=Bdellovibrio bacteriovorus TaxID=959 RepID=UPI0021D36402|nr:hypothetical protein [Bdellovibrio bacteriovorus]UXR65158.1 hypothetical protein EZJ49_02710 [Bdellovibrio bacteriovorus]
MKRAVLFFLGMMTSAQVFAAADSVAVFHRAEKVGVLLNERAAYGRIQQFMDAMGAESRFRWLTADESVKIECAREDVRATCTIRFLPSEVVAIQGRSVKAFVATNDFPQMFEMTFESSMEDRFILKAGPEGLWLWAGKRGENP